MQVILKLAFFLISFVAVTALHSPAFADESSLRPSPFEQALSWLEPQAPSEAVFAELAKFGGLSDGFVRSFPLRLHKRVVADFSNTLQPLLTSGSCHQKVEVKFLKSLGDGEEVSGRDEEFEHHLMKIEVVACLSPKLRAQRLGEVLLSDEYQRRALDVVRESRRVGERTCQRTSAPVLGTSAYCYNSTEFMSDSSFLTHSFNDYNKPDVEAPVFHREMLTAAFETKKATVLYSVVYVRGIALGSVVRFFARGKIETSQKDALDTLAEMAQGEQK